VPSSCALPSVPGVALAVALAGCAPQAVAPSAVAPPRPAAALDPIVGRWQGSMTAGDGRAAMEVTLHVTSGGGAYKGTFTSMRQRAMDYPLDAVTIAGGAAHFVLGGDTVFDGALRDGELAGTFKAEDAAGTFRFLHVDEPPPRYRVEDVTFSNGPIKLAGTLVEPFGKGPFPAVVLLQGSGPEVRWGTSRFIADRLALAGVAALIFDKRGSGDSGGDWKTADYDDLARDALAGVALVGARPEIDAARVGLHGHSQGGFVAVRAAGLAPKRVAFVVAEDTVAGPVWQQDIYRVRGALAREFPPDQTAAAMSVYALFVEVARGKRAFDELEAAERAAAGAPWLAWLGLPPRESWLWPWYAKTGNVDTLAFWRELRVPALVVYGERDALVPVAESIAAIERVLDANGAPYTALIVPRAQHNLTIHPQAGEPFFFWRAAPGYYDTMVAWVKLTTATAPGVR
jgi:uncharacterized protein